MTGSSGNLPTTGHTLSANFTLARVAARHRITKCLINQEPLCQPALLFTYWILRKQRYDRFDCTKSLFVGIRSFDAARVLFCPYQPWMALIAVLNDTIWLNLRFADSTIWVGHLCHAALPCRLCLCSIRIGGLPIHYEVEPFKSSGSVETWMIGRCYSIRKM